MLLSKKLTRIFKFIPIKKSALLGFFCLFISGVGYGQDPDFSLFNSSPQYNPAHVGYTEYSRVILGYRNDFPSYNSSFNTYAAAFDTYLPRAKSGLGVLVMSDQMPYNVFKIITLTAAYSYSIKLGDESFATLGLQGTYQKFTYDPSNLLFFDMINPGGIFLPNQAPYEVRTTNNFNVGTGVAVSINRLSFGAAALNLSQTFTQSLYSNNPLPDPLRINAYVTYDFPIFNEKMDVRDPSSKERVFDFRSLVITPSVGYNQQFWLRQLSFGVTATFGAAYVGLIERQDLSFESISLMLFAGVKYNRFSLSFGGEIANIGTGGKGVINSGLELNLSIQLWGNQAEKQCPSYYNTDRKVRSISGRSVEDDALRKRKHYYR